MNSETKKVYAKRITTASKTELIVIMYEMFLEYVNDAKEKSGNVTELRQNIRSARKVVNKLIESIDLKYDVGKQLMSIYLFVNRELLKADIHADVTNIDEIVKIMETLKTTFEELKNKDTSGPMMKNVQAVYAGLTYGKNDVNEYIDTDKNRGYTI